MNKELKDALASGDPLGFRGAMLKTMTEALDAAAKQISEELDDAEKTAVLKLEMGAKSFGAAYEDTAYDKGVMITILRNKQAAGHFSDFLEDCPYVDNYEINALIKSAETNQEHTTGIDFDDIPDGTLFNFEFIIYLAPYLIDYDYEEDYEGDLEPGNYNIMGEATENLEEVKRTIRVNFRGVKRIKMKCAKGFKWDPTTKTCSKIGGQELAVMRRSIRKALITKKSEGFALRRRVTRKRKKALKYRKSYGLA